VSTSEGTKVVPLEEAALLHNTESLSSVDDSPVGHDSPEDLRGIIIPTGTPTDTAAGAGRDTFTHTPPTSSLFVSFVVTSSVRLKSIFDLCGRVEHVSILLEGCGFKSFSFGRVVTIFVLGATKAASSQGLGF